MKATLLVAVCAAALLASLPTAAARAQLTVSAGEVRDEGGRVVMFRGVNLPWGLRVPQVVDTAPVSADADAAQIRSFGFNLARLQLSWKAIEPGHVGPNDPAICGDGPPQDPGQWDENHAQRYLNRVAAVVESLHRHGIHTLFQIAQYGYNDRFGGPPSHPDWTVCTDGEPITKGQGALSYFQPGVTNAAGHFWRNDVRGNMQGDYARMLRTLAARFGSDPAVVGFELYNEPFSPEAATGDGQFDELVQCFYAGSRDPGRLDDGSKPSCPPGSPAKGAIDAVRSAAPDAIVEPQAHIFTNFAIATHMGPLPAANLVFNFHVYCVSEVLSQPRRERAPSCGDDEERALEQAAMTRRHMASAQQPEGPAWFLSEFGYTQNEETLRHLTGLADANWLGWAYFVWRADRGYPVQDNPGMLRRPDGQTRPYGTILARPYPELLAGTPGHMRYDPDKRRFDLDYQPKGQAPTVVVLPQLAYGKDGACPSAVGASWTIRDDRLLLRADPGVSRVKLQLVPGRCGDRSATCVDSRSFLMRLRGRRGDGALRARVHVNGRPAEVRRRHGQLIARIKMPRGASDGMAVWVRTSVRTRRGRLLRSSIAYRLCA